MSTVAESQKFVSVEEYLRREAESEIRQEYFAGVIGTMADSREGHEVISLNLATEIHRHLRGKPCRAFKSDMKVRVEVNEEEFFYYPDIVVDCGKPDPNATFQKEPRLIVEVLSEPKRDLIEKLFAYRHIESLEEYAVIDQDAKHPRARVFRRSDNWEMEEGVVDGILHLRSIDFSMPVEELFLL